MQNENECGFLTAYGAGAHEEDMDGAAKMSEVEATGTIGGIIAGAKELDERRAIERADIADRSMGETSAAVAGGSHGTGIRLK